MERTIITISESGYVNIPDSNVWMPEMELVELFGVMAPTLRAVIKAIYRNRMLNPETSRIRQKMLEGLTQQKKERFNCKKQYCSWIISVLPNKPMPNYRNILLHLAEYRIN